MSGHYLPLATIAWGLSLYYLLGNIEGLGKYDGLLGIPAIEFFGTTLNTGRSFYYLLWTLVILAALAVIHLLDSRTGRAMRALKGGSHDGRGDGRGHLPDEGHGLRALRRCWPASPAGCSRTSSAP